MEDLKEVSRLGADGAQNNIDKTQETGGGNGGETRANLQSNQRNKPKRVPPNRLSHGMYSGWVRRRYTDRRTREGKQLARVMEGLTKDLGGPECLTAAQQILLASIQSKLIVLLQIGKFTDGSLRLVSETGELPPALGRSYLSYAAELRRDLEALSRMGGQSKKVPDLGEYLEQAYSKNGGKK